MYKTSKRFVNKVAELALSKKAENVLSLDLRGLTTTCDFFVICGGTSEVHVKAIADAVVRGRPLIELPADTLVVQSMFQIAQRILDKP